MPDNWRSVEIKHLRALRAVADTGTFWAAAVELNSSLSTVSDHITALEALVGQRLIERSRGRRTLELTEAAHDNDLIDAVEGGDLDLTFAIQPIPAGPFEVRELMRDPYVLVTPAGSAMARHRPQIGDLAGLPMVGYQHGKHQDLAEDFLLGRGVRPRIVFRSNDNGTVQAMVAS